jgi:hypothetical protein
MLSSHRHPSPEEPPHRREPQLLPTKLFAALSEHPCDPLSVLSFPHRVLFNGAPWPPCSGEPPARQ